MDGEGDASGVAEVVPEVSVEDQGWCVVVVSACDVEVFGVRWFDGEDGGGCEGAGACHGGVPQSSSVVQQAWAARCEFHVCPHVGQSCITCRG